MLKELLKKLLKKTSTPFTCLLFVFAVACSKKNTLETPAENSLHKAFTSVLPTGAINSPYNPAFSTFLKKDGSAERTYGQRNCESSKGNWTLQNDQVVIKFETRCIEDHESEEFGPPSITENRFRISIQNNKLLMVDLEGDGDLEEAIRIDLPPAKE